MLKLLFWLFIGAAAYLYYRSREANQAKLERELEEERRRQIIVDVEAEEIDLNRRRNEAN